MAGPWGEGRFAERSQNPLKAKQNQARARPGLECGDIAADPAYVSHIYHLLLTHGSHKAQQSWKKCAYLWAEVLGSLGSAEQSCKEVMDAHPAEREVARINSSGFQIPSVKNEKSEGKKQAQSLNWWICWNITPYLNGDLWGYESWHCSGIEGYNPVAGMVELGHSIIVFPWK